MASRYDDELWNAVPLEPGPPPAHVTDFVRRLAGFSSALDLGCGDGRLTAELTSGPTIAADVSRVALERARGRLPAVDFAELDPGADLPFRDGEFDLVLCADVIEHVQDVQSLLSEARRVLRPGGTLAITTPACGRVTAARALMLGFGRTFDPLSPHLRFFSRRSLGQLLDGMGFAVASLERSAGTLLARATR